MVLRGEHTHISSNMSLGKIALPDDHTDNPVDEESEISTTARPTLTIHPTISPPTVIIPIVSSIIVVPILIGVILCLLREERKNPGTDLSLNLRKTCPID